MKDKLVLEDIVGYLPHKLKGILLNDLTDEFSECDWVSDESIFHKKAIWTYAGYCDEDLQVPLGEGDFSGFLIKKGNSYTSIGRSVKPLLVPLSFFKEMIIRDIKLELGASHNQVMEFFGLMDGEIKLENITTGLYFKLCESHIDYRDLIGRGLAIDKTLK